MEIVFEVIRIRQEIRELEGDYDLLANTQIKNPHDVLHFASQLIGDEDREIFLVLVLNTKNEIIAVHRCHIGSINSSIVSPREVFKSAILNNGASIIVAHNHPSFSLVPSPEDIEVTKRLVESGSILGIELLDHLIVNNKTGISLREEGYM